ncbi:MAG: HupE/UreJ family protein [Gammaproteobacteria bacterium]|nr:MAG: HupE/UreJ family protein [Gammaproteobacteria bacterium]
MHKKVLFAISTVAISCVATTTLAHPGHADPPGGFGAGFAHPLSGLDHLLAMVVIGIWAAQLGGRAVWAVPLSFLCVMALGATFALNGVAPFEIEAGIAASLLALGLLVISARRLPVASAATLTGLFALFHGAAHGSELPGLADPFGYTGGFLAATAMLHVFGVAIGVLMQRRAPALARITGAATAVAGAIFLAAA